MEKRHLHHRVDTRAQLAFAGDFLGVDDIEPCLFLVQYRLHILRQSIPHLFGAVRCVEQENAAGFQPLGHLVFIDKLQLVAADEIGFIHQIGGINRLFTDAQMGNRQATGLFGVIDKIALGVPRRGVTDNFDIVFGGRHAAIAA